MSPIDHLQAALNGIVAAPVIRVECAEWKLRIIFAETGEYQITIHTDWRLWQDRSMILASSDGVSSRREADFLLGAKVTSCVLDRRNCDLVIEFSTGHRLEVFCMLSSVYEIDDEASCYDFFTRNEVFEVKSPESISILPTDPPR